MASLRKALLISTTECRIRLKETGEHKIVQILPLRERHMIKIDNDGDEYQTTEQDYIIINGKEVVGFLRNPSKGIMNDVFNEVPK